MRLLLDTSAYSSFLRGHPGVHDALQSADSIASVPTNDLWIAASAMQYGLTVLTADAHFQHVAQVLVHYVDLP